MCRIREITKLVRKNFFFGEVVWRKGLGMYQRQKQTCQGSARGLGYDQAVCNIQRLEAACVEFEKLQN